MDIEHLRDLNLWIAMESESDPSKVIVVYQERNSKRANAASTEVPWHMLTLGDATLLPPAKCRALIDLLISMSQTFAQCSEHLSQQQLLVTADPDHALMNVANERLEISPVQPVFPLKDGGNTAELEKQLTYCDDEDDALPPDAPNEEPSAEQEKAAREEEADFVEKFRQSVVEISKKDAVLKENETELRRMKKEKWKLEQAQRRRQVREEEKEGDRMVLALMNGQARTLARKQQEQQMLRRNEAEEQQKRDKEIRPRALLTLISRITCVTGERKQGSFAQFRHKLMTKIANWGDGRHFYRFDGQWVRIKEFEISNLVQGLTVLDQNSEFAHLDTTESATGASLCPLARTGQRLMPNGTVHDVYTEVSLGSVRCV